MNNDGMTTRDYVYVHDVIGALIAAANNTEEVGVINIGTGVQTTTNDVLAAVAKEVGVTPSISERPDIVDEVKTLHSTPRVQSRYSTGRRQRRSRTVLQDSESYRV